MTVLSADTPAPTRDQRLAQVLLFVTPAMFATNMLLARATADFIPPVALAVWRWTGVALLLGLFCWRELWQRRAALRREGWNLLILGFLGMNICGAVVYLGAATTTATNIGLIYSVSPVLILVLSRVLFAEPMSARQGLGTMLALCGMLLIVVKGDPAVLLSLAFTPGDLMILAAAIAWALYGVLLKRWPSALGLNARLAAIAFAGVLTMLPFLAWETATVGPARLDARTLATIAALVLIPGLGAYGTYGYITKHLGPARTGLLLYLSPVYVSVLAWMLLGEAFAAYHWAGAALVLTGLYFATLPPKAA